MKEDDKASTTLQISPTQPGPVKFECSICGGRMHMPEDGARGWESVNRCIFFNFENLGLGTFTICPWCIVAMIRKAIGKWQVDATRGSE